MSLNLNFSQADEPLLLSEHATLFTVLPVRTYSQLVYSFYQLSNGIKSDENVVLFDENQKDLSKQLTVIQNPLSFDFDSLSLKKQLFSRIIETIDMDEREKIEMTYAELVRYFNVQIFDDIEIDVSISEGYKLEDLFKLLKIKILDETSSIFERTQLILNVLHELGHHELIIFCGLGNWLSLEQYQLLIENVNLNQQQVLFLENKKIEQCRACKLITLDEDLILWQKML